MEVKNMSVLGNIIWIVLGGIIGAILWSIAGVLCMITVIGIPLGLQCFKIAALTLVPFGRDVEIGNLGAVNLLGNILWIILLGWELAVFHAVTGLIMCVTIIGIPFGKQHFKLAALALLPFGARLD